MIYYTSKGQPSFVPQTEEDRFAVWIETMSDWKLVVVKEAVKDRWGKPVKDRLGRVIHKEVEKVVGTGIAEPTADELAKVYAKPCRYRRAARASCA